MSSELDEKVKILHDLLTGQKIDLIHKWGLMFSHSYSFHEDSTGRRLQIILNVENKSLPQADHYYFTTEDGFLKYTFLKCEIDDIIRSLQRFLNLKAFL